MHAPQIIVICLFVIGVYSHLTNDDEPIKGHYNFFGRLLNVTIWSSLLYWGGFWN